MIRSTRTAWISFLFLAAAIPACASHSGADDSTSAASTAAPTPEKVAPEKALAKMKEVVPVGGAATKKVFQRVDVASLSKQLNTRFTNAKGALEDFAFNHSDMGDVDSEIDFVLSAPGASTFVGYVVFAEGGDDADRYASKAVAYYTTEGALLDVETRSSGVSDSEDAGDWSKVDMKLLDAQEKTLRTAFTYDANKSSFSLDKGKTEKVSIDTLPFAALAHSVEAEITGSTLAHSDMGDSATWFVSVKGSDGAVAGYVLGSDGGDDADLWAAAGYALFSAGGQLLDRQISTGGRADTMGDDALVPAKPQAQPSK